MRGALAAWALVLGKHSGQEEVMMGLLYANREHAGLEEVVGYFVHMLPVRMDCRKPAACASQLPCKRFATLATQ